LLKYIIKNRKRSIFARTVKVTVARFFLTQYNKTWEKCTKLSQNYQMIVKHVYLMAVIYSKWAYIFNSKAVRNLTKLGVWV
jgi:hypothetical protein